MLSGEKYLLSPLRLCDAANEDGAAGPACLLPACNLQGVCGAAGNACICTIDCRTAVPCTACTRVCLMSLSAKDMSQGIETCQSHHPGSTAHVSAMTQGQGNAKQCKQRHLPVACSAAPCIAHVTAAQHCSCPMPSSNSLKIECDIALHQMQLDGCEQGFVMHSAICWVQLALNTSSMQQLLGMCATRDIYRQNLHISYLLRLQH